MFEAEASRRREREILRTLKVVLENQDAIMNALCQAMTLQAVEYSQGGAYKAASELAGRRGVTKATLDIIADYIE